MANITIDDKQYDTEKFNNQQKKCLVEIDMLQSEITRARLTQFVMERRVAELAQLIASIGEGIITDESAEE